MFIIQIPFYTISFSLECDTLRVSGYGSEWFETLLLSQRMKINPKIKRICVFGDSIAWGACDYEKGGWVERLKVDLLKHTDIDVYNFGVSGNTTIDLLARFGAEVAIMKPEIIVIAIGINDSKYLSNPEVPEVNLKDFETNTLALIDKARRVTNRLAFIGLTPVDETKTMPRTHQENIKFYENRIIQNYNSVVASICQREEIQFINLFNLLKNSDLEDGLHPNSNGHQIIFDQAKPVIENLIQ